MNKLLSIIVIFLFTSCAYIIDGQKQTILFKAVDAKTLAILKDVECTIFDGRRQKYFMVRNPSEFTVYKGEEVIKVLCYKDNYEQLNDIMFAEFNNMTVGNVAYFPGFMVDMVTHSYKLYPKVFIINMQKIDKSKVRIQEEDLMEHIQN